MGYRSEVYLKTTTEGYIMMKKFNDEITEWNNKPLSWSEIYTTPNGNYKIEFHDIKWYSSYEQVKNFMGMLEKFEEEGIPYSFIRIGEDLTDIEHKRSYMDDEPFEIECFEPVIDVNDEEVSDYTQCDDFTKME